MIVAILIFLIIQTLAISGLLYLNWKNTPAETQKEIRRKVEPIKSEVKEWTPPEKEEARVFEEALKNTVNIP